MIEFKTVTLCDKGWVDEIVRAEGSRSADYNIEFKGNAPVDYDPKVYSGLDDGSMCGVYAEAFNIGGYIYDTYYYADMNDITASAFKIGLKLTNVIGNSKISNIHVYNCYSPCWACT